MALSHCKVQVEFSINGGKHATGAHALDRQTDALVYEVYGLTEEEIGVVEGLDHE
jgi:hypothetical protein